MFICLYIPGNLHYSYVISSDAENGDVYRCRALNTPLDRLLAASYYRIEVEERKSVQEYISSTKHSTLKFNIWCMRHMLQHIQNTCISKHL